MNAHHRAVEGLQGPSAETIEHRKKLIQLDIHPSSRLFRKKPIVIEAVQWMGDNEAEILAFCPTAVRVGESSLIIPTLEGDHRAEPGDWIIRGIAGEFYPCQNDIFNATYARVYDEGELDVRD